jgi:DNA-binding IclR family transcriptional regulator
MASQKSDSRSEHKELQSFQPLVPAVEAAARILFCLGESQKPKMSLTEICSKLGIYKSKGYSILNTLRQFGLVEKDPQTKTYSLGPNLIFLSRSVLDNLNYPEVVSPFLESLARETHGTSLLALISGSHVFVVAKREGNQNIGFGVRLGHRFHLTLGAHGRVIAAFLPEEERERLLGRKKLYFYGDPSRMDVKRLREEVLRCRRDGFAQDLGEVTPGVHVVSAPVFSHRDKLIGCLILIGTFPEEAMKDYGPKVAEVAKQVSRKLGADIERIFQAHGAVN